MELKPKHTNQNMGLPMSIVVEIWTLTDNTWKLLTDCELWCHYPVTVTLRKLQYFNHEWRQTTSTPADNAIIRD